MTIQSWQKKRERLSAKFDADCHALASDFIGLQTAWLRALIQAARNDPKTHIPQSTLKDVALSVRKMQEVGRMALGETTDRKQLELDFGDLPPVEITVVRARKNDCN